MTDDRDSYSRIHKRGLHSKSTITFPRRRIRYERKKKKREEKNKINKQANRTVANQTWKEMQE